MQIAYFCAEEWSGPRHVAPQPLPGSELIYQPGLGSRDVSSAVAVRRQDWDSLVRGILISMLIEENCQQCQLGHAPVIRPREEKGGCYVMLWGRLTCNEGHCLLSEKQQGGPIWS